MKKSLISNIPSLPLTGTIPQDTKYAFMLKMVGSLLQITTYHRDDILPSFDTFIDVENEDWLTKKNEYCFGKISNIKYLTSKFDRMIYLYSKSYYFSNEDLLVSLFKFDKEDNLYRELENWQCRVREKQNDIKLKKKFDKWDKELSIVPKDILPSFKDYMKREADGKYFMFFENVNSKTGYCSHCAKEVLLMKKPVQNDSCRCPSCRRKAVMKRRSQITTLATCYYSGAYAQQIGDTIIIRKFTGQQYYRNCSYDNPNMYLNEEERYILYKDGKISNYWHGMYNSRICRWNKCVDVNQKWITLDTYWLKAYAKNIYKKNLSTIMKNSSYKLWEKKPTDAMSYLIMEYQSNWLIEKLVKIGLYNIAKKFMYYNRYYCTENINEVGKDLGQILKIDNARLKRLKQYDNWDYLQWLIEEKKQNTIYNDDMLKNFVSAHISETSFAHLPDQMNYTQIDNYIKKQSLLSSEDYVQVLRTWRDYLDIAKRCNWDTDSSLIYKPADLKEMHAKVIIFADNKSIKEEVDKLETEWPKVDENLSKMARFAYENDKYCMVVPNNIEDIVREGHCLQHCIHKSSYYFNNITNQETYIFFLRKKNKKDVPWYTIEIEHNGNILQKRTTGDNQNKDLNPAISFLKEFQQFFVKNMTEEDKILGMKAEKNRKKRYADIREQKKKIWHGKLQGVLLADVLEADFIAV